MSSICDKLRRLHRPRPTEAPRPETAAARAVAAAPDDGAEILRAVPVNDLVLYPQQELAPEQVEGWAWVRHDPEQENIWQGGDRGWMQLVYMTTCG